MKLQNQAIAKLRKQNKKPTDEVDINLLVSAKL